MQIAPILANEEARLDALASYRLMYTPPEEVYDEITKVASDICGTPIAFLSLLDENCEWLKAKQGLETEEVPRAISFCAHTILEPEIMVVPDARYDKRFHNNPLTTGEPHIVFYAGVPVINDQKFPLGVLAVADTRPRELPEEKLLSLKAVAKLVATHFELRKSKMLLEEDQQRQQETQHILNTMLRTVDLLNNNNPYVGQIRLIDSLRNTIHSLLTKTKETEPIDFAHWSRKKHA